MNRVETLRKKAADPACSPSEAAACRAMADKLEAQERASRATKPNTKEFVRGMYAKQPHESAPPWVKFGVTIRKEELMQWLAVQEGNWVNAQVCQSKSGKWYVEVNKWEN